MFYYLLHDFNYVSMLTCIVPTLGPNAERANDGNNFMLMSILLIVAVILYIFRPNSLRGSRSENEKSQRDRQVLAFKKKNNETHLKLLKSNYRSNSCYILQFKGT